LDQIDERYADRFLGGDGRVVKVALVVARRIFVLSRFEAVNGQLVRKARFIFGVTLRHPFCQLVFGQPLFVAPAVAVRAEDGLVSGRR
jgi:hypothetical protein